MDIGDKAKALHDDKSQKLNCAQCVLCSLSEKTGLDDGAARRLASGFGGGMRCGEICGAVSGGAMAIGLAASDGDGTAQGMTAPLVTELCRSFKKQYGALRCSELVAANGGKQMCPELISYCARLAAAIIESNKK